MAKYCLRKPSKRQSCAKRYKIAKKVRDHNRKLKKEAKKSVYYGPIIPETKKWRAKNKPINVPNDCPFKEEVLMEAREERERIEAKKIEDKKVAKLAKQKCLKFASIGTKRKLEGFCGDLQEVVSKASEQTEEMAKLVRNESIENIAELKQKLLKQYASEVRKTIESADIIIEVLDARDPLGSRSRNIEEDILKSGKRLVLLLNKIDLVPKENVKEWLIYLRQQSPTIAFKASTQKQNDNLGRFETSNLHSSSSKCVGADLVMKLLSNYCRNKNIKESVRVGVIGFPNVGKSSFINSLKRKRVCNVGALPGVTRQMQEIDLDKHIRLLDSPGVVLEMESHLDKSEIALKNAVRIENIADPIAPIRAILRRCCMNSLMIRYNIPQYRGCEQFLALIANKIGRLKKGGIPDLKAAARKILTDWNSGKLRYFTQPPKYVDMSPKLCSTELLSEMSKEFDLNALNKEVKKLVESMFFFLSFWTEDICNIYVSLELPTRCSVKRSIQYDPTVPAEEDDGQNYDVSMEVDDTAGRTFISEVKRNKTQEKGDTNEYSFPESFAIDGNSQINRAIKLAVKKKKQRNKKLEKRTEEMINTMTATSLSDKQENYNFDTIED
ncbi:unnamed protein product [Thelazia callipaeda]|uniref:Guanine nucleotide-binding protein-like 3 homolog n=1 Tax=Thelazia callipaeda TaxID=103827 RepID=A0A0N5D2C5_THECL|nr:unnamed protein product [Thelazia callipaeda]